MLGLLQTDTLARYLFTAITFDCIYCAVLVWGCFSLCLVCVLRCSSLRTQKKPQIGYFCNKNLFFGHVRKFKHFLCEKVKPGVWTLTDCGGSRGLCVSVILWFGV